MLKWLGPIDVSNAARLIRIDNFGDVHKYWMTVYWSADLRQWPFDTQRAPITMRHPFRPASELVLEPWEGASFFEPLDTPGWLTDPSGKILFSSSTSKGGLSQLKAEVLLVRPRLKAILKVSLFVVISSKKKKRTNI